MRLEIPKGKSKIELTIPNYNLQYVIADDALKTDKATKNVDKGCESCLIKNALTNPINSKKLNELARDKKSAAIIASDITRPCPSYKFLPYLIDELNEGGVEDIKIIFGLGIHRKHSRKEREALAGSYAASKAKLIDSDKSRYRLLGRTSYGTPVEIFKEALDVELLIATGNIEYHYFAGYSGGAKAVMPGISSYAAIANNHSYMLSGGAVAGNIISNPVRVDIEEAGRIVGIDFIFNIILDDKKNIIDAVAGVNNDAFLEGVKRYDVLFGKEVKEKADIVIVSPGGYPKDINLYQSHKALENVKEIVIPRGKIILIAQCSEGFGDDTFESWMYKAKDYLYLKKKIKEKFVLGAHKAVAISKIISQFEVILFSDFDRNTTEAIGFKKVEDLQGFINKRIKLNKGTKIIAVPTGRLVKFNNL
jgi:nickel-dependent lactate racemase